MPILYLDCFSGISGDMWVASLLDLGMSLDDLNHYIRPLHLGVELQQQTCTLSGIRAQRFSVGETAAPPLRHLNDILDILEIVPDRSIRDQAATIFYLLAEAEAQVHGIPVSSVHFHEIGAADTVVDILGVLYGLQQLNIDKVYASPLPWPRGIISIAHGQMPLPAPATAELLRNVPCYGVDAAMELVTPTGAVLLKALVETYGELPPCRPLSIGYGAGSKQRPDGVPNLLRAVYAETMENTAVYENISVLECQVDDMNPEFFTFLFETLSAHRSIRDFYLTPIHMKKSRPGFLLTVLCDPDTVREAADLILLNTTSLGVRISRQQRLALPRRETTMLSDWGPVRCKMVWLPDGSRRCKPEYEDCARISRQHRLPLTQIYTQLMRQFPEDDQR